MCLASGIKFKIMQYPKYLFRDFNKNGAVLLLHFSHTKLLYVFKAIIDIQNGVKYGISF